MIYADFLALMNIFKGAVDMNENSLEKCEKRVVFWIFNWKFELNTPLVFSFSDTFRDG